MKKRPDQNRHRFGISCSCSTRPKRFPLTEARKLVEKRCYQKGCWYFERFKKGFKLAVVAQRALHGRGHDG